MTEKIKIENYVLGKTLGVGNFGKVRVARDEITGSKVAIKIINKKRMKKSNMSTKIKREIRLMRYFDHQNIVKLYEVLESSTDIFVVMEYVSGGELFEVVAQRGKLTESEARFYFRQIIQGVEYCHNNLVSHRDLKLENILVDDSNTVKITDFGLSNLMKDGKYLKTPCGSPNYTAPEVLDRRAYCGSEVDSWSCGVILFTLIAGFLPFDEEVISELFKKIKEAKLEMPSHFSPALCDLISRLLRKDPTERLPINDVKLHPWMLEERTDVNLSRLGIPHKKINEQVFQKLINTKNINFYNFPVELIREAILKKREYSFVVSYHLLLDDFNKKKEKKKTSVNSEGKLTFLGEYDLLRQEADVFFTSFSLNFDFGNEPWLYGLTFPFPARFLIKAIFECLTLLDTFIKVKSSEYRIKCFYMKSQKIMIDKNESVGYVNPFVHPINEENSLSEVFKQEKKSPINGGPTAESKNFDLVFTIQIYAMPNKRDHMIDIHLNNGNPIVFIEYTHKFYSLLYKVLLEMYKAELKMAHHQQQI